MSDDGQYWAELEQQEYEAWLDTIGMPAVWHKKRFMGIERENIVELTASVLRETLDYLPDSGLFIWKINAARNIKAGSIARIGARPGQHLQIKVYGRLYYAHRLAWLHTYGEWPKHFIDHIDGDKSNNRLANLRDVCRSVNGQNQRKAMRDNKSGKLGVSVVGARFRALIVVDGKQRYLGTYDDAETAHEVYLAEKRKFHAGCSI